MVNTDITALCYNTSSQTQTDFETFSSIVTNMNINIFCGATWTASEDDNYTPWERHFFRCVALLAKHSGLFAVIFYFSSALNWDFI